MINFLNITAALTAIVTIASVALLIHANNNDKTPSVAVEIVGVTALFITIVINLILGVIALCNL